MRRTFLLAASLLTVLGLLVGPASASSRHRLPETIELTSPFTEDVGFQAEGIATAGRFAWTGSLATGTILRTDLVTGQSGTLVESADGPAVGLATDRRGRLWVAGGPNGSARVYDARSGTLLDALELTDAAATFVNDVTVTRHAAWFTDSFNDVLYRVPLGRHGRIGEPEAVTLGGDFELAGPDAFNANGIVATRDGRLIVAQSTDPADGEGSALYVVDAPRRATATDATRITLDDEIANADGLVLRGRTLYVVENRLDRSARIRLSRDLTEGAVVGRISDDDLATPTTAALALGGLYVVNARFADIEAGADPAALTYEIVRLPRR